MKFSTENQARRWAKKNKYKVKCVEYVKSGCRVQVARRGKPLKLRVDDLHSTNAQTTS